MDIFYSANGDVIINNKKKNIETFAETTPPMVGVGGVNLMFDLSKPEVWNTTYKKASEPIEAVAKAAFITSGAKKQYDDAKIVADDAEKFFKSLEIGYKDTEAKSKKAFEDYTTAKGWQELYAKVLDDATKQYNSLKAQFGFT